VLRKIMRRAVSHGVLLGVDRPFLAGAVDAVVEVMDGDPVLDGARERLRAGAEREEALFRRTVEQGMRRIDELLQQLEDDRVWSASEDGARVLSGETAFRLYDTFGCPLELTASVGVRRGFEVDEAGFFAAMEEQKSRSRESWKGGAAGSRAVESFFVPRRAELGATVFTGYTALDGEARVVALCHVDEREALAVERAGEGACVAIATSSTPFYGESGGQVGDAGEFVSDSARVRIEDTQKILGGEVFLHFGTVEEGELGSGARVEQRVDAARRRRITENHSSTHLVHHALREILGGHVSQKGSWVGPDRLRFDFSHPQPVGEDELARVEARVNELIRSNFQVEAAELPYAEAIAKGALAFFGDKYGDVVRMISMGPSRELCGGTHVARTGELGIFSFVSEASVASGVRRVEALAGPGAEAHLREARTRLARLAELLKTAPEEALQKLGDLQEESRRLRRKVEELAREAAGSAAAELEGAARQVAGHRVIAAAAAVETREALRELGDRLRASGKATIVVLGAEMDGKVALVAALSDDVVKAGRLKAGDLVGRVAKVAGGGGGGKAHLATAGAKDPARLAKALEAVPAIVTEILG
jgi:alanyl-tRNA synthetase